MADAVKTHNSDEKPSAEMQGGARAEIVTVTPVAQSVEDGIDVIVTRPGTLGALGIVEEGTRLTVLDAQYSGAWMRPATQKAAARAAKVLKTLKEKA